MESPPESPFGYYKKGFLEPIAIKSGVNWAQAKQSVKHQETIIANFVVGYWIRTPPPLLAKPSST
jgi:hypothetical protein